jgi:nitrogen-specific signal transduction histidine kinase
VKGDSGQIHQVFTNLLLNAVQVVNSNHPGKGKPEPESREETLSSQPVL